MFERPHSISTLALLCRCETCSTIALELTDFEFLQYSFFAGEVLAF